MIEVKDLVKKYGDHLAVDHLSFRLEPGRVYGFLGPNGAGKSTTMNIMTGYLGATSGSVVIDGHDILKEPEEAKKCIGYLPELPPLYQEMTVLEYLDFVAEMKKVSKKDREKHLNDIILIGKLKNVENRIIQNLSKGYKQRVGLAQAMVSNPEILILDEPTVGLDPAQIMEMRQLIRKLSKEHTVILSSHILAEIREVCDYILIIANGKLVASDTPENLEKNISGNRHIELEVLADEAKIKAALADVEDIKEMKCHKEEESLMVSIVSRNARDIREEIFKACVRHGISIVTLMFTQTTLEQIFLQLTQNNNVSKIAGNLKQSQQEAVEQTEEGEEEAADESDL